MKSNKATGDEVKAETYCRHGFHDWMEVPEEDGVGTSSKTQTKCRHCGKSKHAELKPH